MSRPRSVADFTTDEVIADIVRRLDEGHVGYHGLLSSNQADHRDMWVCLRRFVVELLQRYEGDANLLKVDREMLRLADEHTPAPPFAVNTTVYARDITKHQAEAA